ncbi:Nuclear import receptor [Physocladia obscura]|uniref:Nuclear import receptor n=1 Tax=Physocladia obscura TaxID=109957 RepID=A0AAD5XAA8_9FUNG|nr:Nuclear import receptor [Physocladia obscura]
MAVQNQPYSIETVANAVAQLYANPASTSNAVDISRNAKAADAWLRDFQKSAEAWSVAETMLRTDPLPLEALLFAAQTIRQKTRYDMSQIESPVQRLQLRDALLGHLIRYARANSRLVVRQLSMALASIAVHFKQEEWVDPVATFVNVFGNPESWLTLTQVLTVLPYEFEDSGTRTESSFFRDLDEISERRQKAIFENSSGVLLYVLTIMENCFSGDQNDSNLIKQSLECLRAWFEAGNISLDSIAATSLVPHCFTYINNENQDDAVFDTAVDVISEIIRRTGSLSSAGRESATVQPLIESIYTGLGSLSGILNFSITTENEDKARALCRLFVSAGESYMNLILSNWNSWQIIVAAILRCTSIKDLEIVAITFQFWMALADEVEAVLKSSNANLPSTQTLIGVYRQLNDVMIEHLRYPLNNDWTAKERDEFRDFRHNMGDVLKACVFVLGQQEALARPYNILKGFIVDGSAGGSLDPSIPWQRVEAPLFALRTIGRNISDEEGTVLPVIMSMLPQLPQHPKVRYAAILVIGRYASWTKHHPEFIPYQMTFISKGFEDSESISAASQSLRYLCDECGDRLVDYLSQLHPFYLTIVKTLDRLDKNEVISALAHVIKHVPVVSNDPNSPDMLKVLEMFCLPIAQRLHQIGLMGSAAAAARGKDLQEEISDLIEQFQTFVYNAQPAITPNMHLQHPCAVLFKGMWPVLDSLFTLEIPRITNSVCKLIVKCIDAHGVYFRGIMVSEVLPRLAAVYETTANAGAECSSLMWAASKCVRTFGDAEDGLTMHAVMQQMSGTAFQVIQAVNGKIENISPTIEDYFLLLAAFAKSHPVHFIQSPHLSLFLQCAIACMPIQQFDTWLALYREFLMTLFTLASPQMTQVPTPLYTPLTTAVQQHASAFATQIVRGVTTSFPHREDIAGESASGISVIGTIVCGLVDVVGGGNVEVGLRVLGGAIDTMPDEKYLPADKSQFAEKLKSALEKRDFYRIDVLIHEYGVKYRRRNNSRK